MTEPDPGGWVFTPETRALPSTAKLQMGSEAKAPVPELESFILEGPLMTACCKQEDGRKWGPRAADGEPLPPHSRVLWGLEGEDLEVLLSQDD